jgi:hypothetical protein
MNFDPEDLLLAGLIGGTILVSLVAILGGFAHYRRERLLTHQERMKALELGREVPEDPAITRARVAAAQIEDASDAGNEEKSYAGKCFSTAGHACFWGFLFAIGAAAKEGGNAPGAAYAIAAAAGAVGVTGLICGTVLASRTTASAEPPTKARYGHDGL